MSALQILEQTVKTDHHARAREMAKVIAQRVSELIAAGESAINVHTALDQLYLRFRGDGQTVERDAISEVLDWFEDELLVQTA